MSELYLQLRLKEWKDMSPLQDSVKVPDINEPNFWFYIPELSTKRGQLEVRCVDSTHLLTLLRRVVVEYIVDQMSMAMGVTHFS